jgi:hypothetical protein
MAVQSIPCLSNKRAAKKVEIIKFLDVSNSTENLVLILVRCSLRVNNGILNAFFPLCRGLYSLSIFIFVHWKLLGSVGLAEVNKMLEQSYHVADHITSQTPSTVKPKPSNSNRQHLQLSHHSTKFKHEQTHPHTSHHARKTFNRRCVRRRVVYQPFFATTQYQKDRPPASLGIQCSS